MVEDIHTSSHLTHARRVNLGSFYTPYKYVMLVKEWLDKYDIASGSVIFDSSCGYGAFFDLTNYFKESRFIGNDIDSEALNNVSEQFPSVNALNENSLCEVSRKKFGISDDERLVMVGNPPYNDVTSQINKSVKNPDVSIDDDIKTRDLGLSFMLSYNKLKADYVAVLHPLSYLIKKANFLAASSFFMNYSLKEHIIFNSQEFANTSKLHGFPVIVALYKRTAGDGLSYDDVYGMQFHTVDGHTFSLSKWDYVANYIKKYPHNNRYEDEILFYTLRDINALKRSRTFIKERCANAVDVDPAKLAYYCYIDCFKRFADPPYYMGNFDIPFNESRFDEIAPHVIKVAKSYNTVVFGNCERDVASEEIVKKYIFDVISSR